MGLQTILNGVRQSSAGLSSATTGSERAAFIDDFLSKVLPPTFRFGTGDVTDPSGAKSGQLDVVVEYPFAPSLPTVGAGQSRLYLAEAVAAVIEVKSNLAKQWPETLRTANALAAVRKRYAAAITTGAPLSPAIPLFAVGYTGWTTQDTIQSHFQGAPNIFGALVIDPGLYVSRSGLIATGPLALWCLICDLHFQTNSLLSASTDPTLYAR